MPIQRLKAILQERFYMKL
ncbi:hypothetical protein CWATWH0003_1737b3 [Crocosphaera watsonii WH 0003]|uniref:Uncharacterized protein n=1 Tax=Crocosphaera watsonii WH 0003 TaxID=423471 RepID=G5J2K3_CROWT|nr:hypothetical protein CWATWH0003_1737b3 [Crocosphaera watsonii WH 0003]